MCSALCLSAGGWRLCSCSRCRGFLSSCLITIFRCRSARFTVGSEIGLVRREIASYGSGFGIFCGLGGWGRWFSIASELLIGPRSFWWEFSGGCHICRLWTGSKREVKPRPWNWTERMRILVSRQSYAARYRRSSEMIWWVLTENVARWNWYTSLNIPSES